MSDVVHDGPLIVERGPGATTGRHLKDDAAKRPDVDGTLAAFVGALDDFRRHVHGSSGHGFLLAGQAGGGVGEVGVVWLEGLVLAGDDFSGTEVDIFDYSVVIEEDVYRRSALYDRSLSSVSVLSGLMSRWQMPL